MLPFSRSALSKFGTAQLILTLLVFTNLASFAQSALTVSRKRPPKLNISTYQKIAIGDIVAATGSKTARSMDLTDALTSQLFNANAQEIIDRNALESILASQKTSLTTINEASASALSKKLSSAVMIIGRIQNEKIYKEQKNTKNIIVSNGCSYMYWWELSGDITVQIKVIDIKTGKMIFSNPIVQPIKLETKRECVPTTLGDTEPLLKDATIELATEISKLIVPFNEKLTINFDKPMLSIFKNPFKKLPAAISSFQVKNNDVALAILKEYADDTKLKPDVHAMAVYNYGAGLFIAERYDLSEEVLKTAVSLGSLSASALLSQTQIEKKYQKELIKTK